MTEPPLKMRRRVEAETQAMPKTPSTYAVFDVASEPVLDAIATWRETNVRPILDQTLIGDFGKCSDASDDELAAWRGRAIERKLLSICAHGDTATVRGCSNKTDIYIVDELRQSPSETPEVPGAVIHLLACSTMPDLGQALVAAGAQAVVGYSAPFSFVDDADKHSATLASSTTSALECDAQILYALALGKNIDEAVAASKAWEQEEKTRLIQTAERMRSDAPPFLSLVWRLAVMTNNSANLAVAGDHAATVTTKD